MRPFTARAGKVSVHLAVAEQKLLRALCGELIELLSPEPARDPWGLGVQEDARISDDPVLARLLPDAHVEDAAASTEFRRLTEHGIRSHKVEALRAMTDTLDAAAELDSALASAWLSALNDLRLAVGTRLGMRQQDAEPLGMLYDWLTWLQDRLIAVMDAHADTLPS